MKVKLARVIAALGVILAVPAGHAALTVTPGTDNSFTDNVLFNTCSSPSAIVGPAP